jgi:segregation and condensation protein A
MTRAISLPQYEGPIEMLLALVRRNEFDIRDLPMAEITRQFLEYLAAAEKLDLDLDSEWFYVAALLIQIKSRSLLPPVPGEEQADPRGELVRRLLDREQLAGAAAFLENQWAAVGGWPAPPPPDSPLPPSDGAGVTRGSLNLLEVLQLTQRAVVSVANQQELELPADAVPVEEMLTLLEQQVIRIPAGGQLDFSQLWTSVPSNQHRSALFLALLEGARAGHLDLEQTEPFAPIRVRPGAKLMAV